MSEMNEEVNWNVDEHVVLSKFDGDPSPETEFERIVIHNGVVVEHSVIMNQEVVGTVEGSEILGSVTGRLISDDD